MRGRWADLTWWGLVLAGMLSINVPFPPRLRDVAVVVAGTAVAAVVNRAHPPAALAYGLALAQWDERFYAVAGLVAFLAGRRPGRAPGHPLAWLAALAVPVVIALPRPGTVHELANLPVELLVSVVPAWLVGRYQSQRIALGQAGWERAARLEREQAIVAEQTRLRERARIAQEMHDSLGHDLSLLAVRAGALEYTAGLNEEQRAGVAELRSGTAAALERLHDIIGVLRETEEEDRGAPTDPVGEGLDDLVDRCRASGMDVTLHRPGPASGAGRPPLVEQALHRIAREALTNAAKHAPGAPVRITVEGSGGDTTVRIVNGPPPEVSPPASPAVGSGRGLVGIRERAHLLGGTLAAVATADGGFRVEARLPHRPDHPGPVPRAPWPAETAETAESATASAVAERIAQQDTLRRRFARSLVLVAVAVAFAAVVSLFVRGTPELDEDVYERARVGQSRAELAPSLPDRQTGERPPREPPAPRGARCEYYASSLLFPTHVYRLCFRDGLLVSRHELPLEEDAEGNAQGNAVENAVQGRK
ncbi:sensor histidine kinase [Streptomyces sp. 4N509B]|uniref:sensor histidine kinase n=1 Tax=Streptomyces sp. 4N509B TaxID=3457413 RepID=UPI003FD53F82